MIRLWIWLAIIAVTLGSHSQARRPAGRPAIVTFHIVDSYGKPIPYKVESFHEIDKGGLELAEKFQGLTLKGAEQGKIYGVRLVPLINPQKFLAFTKYIPIGEDYVFIVFAVRESLDLDDRIGPSSVTRFVIKPAPTGDVPAWVTITPAFAPEVNGGGIEATAIDRKGQFTLYGPHGGTYIVSLCQGTKVTKLAVVDIPFIGPENPIEITLK